MAGKRWSEVEVELLRKHYPTMRALDVAPLVGRPTPCIQKMAQMLGIKKDPEALSAIRSRSMRALGSASGRFKKVHGQSMVKHAGSTYNAWSSMRQRCLYEKHRSFKAYGGRGITVCLRWDDFRLFLGDMGERPPGTTLGRIKNELGYEPGNCRWETQEEQQNNRRSNRIMSAFGKSQTMARWAREYGLGQGTLTYRVDKIGMRFEHALTKPVRGGV